MLQFCNDVMNSIPFLAKFAGKIAEPMVVLLSHVPSSSFACSIAKKKRFFPRTCWKLALRPWLEVMLMKSDAHRRCKAVCFSVACTGDVAPRFPRENAPVPHKEQRAFSWTSCEDRRIAVHLSSENLMTFFTPHLSFSTKFVNFRFTNISLNGFELQHFYLPSWKILMAPML